MNKDTKKPRNIAAESYRNRMNAYMQGMKELAEKKKAPDGVNNKEGAKS